MFIWLSFSLPLASWFSTTQALMFFLVNVICSLYCKTYGLHLPVLKDTNVYHLNNRDRFFFPFSYLPSTNPVLNLRQTPSKPAGMS